jgi:hypothetical protein
MSQTFKLNLLVLVCCLCGLVGCSKEETASKKQPSDSAVTSSNSNTAKPVQETTDSKAKSPVQKAVDLPVVNNESFHEALVESAEAYIRFPMVNSVAEVAPTFCAAPSEPEARPKMSQSDDDDSHGKKLYYLFAKDITHYLAPDDKDAPVGQVLVKESWTSKESNPDARNLRNHASGNRINPRVDVGGKVLEIGKRKDLFVMMKLDPKTADTDQGWVYGVVNADTKAVSAAGKVASCMACHESAEHDRLFGTDLAVVNE